MLPESMAAELLAAQVGQETEVDCGLAELCKRTMGTACSVKATARAEAFKNNFGG